jgi:two-component system chemotaxis sensor kinase CheA
MAVDVHQEVFIQEAYELLEELEESLLELEGDTTNLDIVARIFRAMHTVKGSGAMFGFDHIAHLVHDIETAYDKVRNGELQVDRDMLDYSLKSCDVIKEMLEDPAIEANSKVALEIISFFQKYQGISSSEPKQKDMPKAIAENGEGDLKTFRIRFAPHEDILLQGGNPEFLIEELVEMGESKVVAHTSNFPPLEEMNPEKCYTAWDIFLTTAKTENDIKDVFIFVEDDSKLEISVIDDFTTEEDSFKKLGEILIERGDLSEEDLLALLNEKKMLGEMLVDKGLVSADAVVSALEEQKHVQEMRTKKAVHENASSLRVPSEKLDSLVDLVGELVTVQARLNQTATLQMNPEFIKIAEEVERLVWELRDNTMSIRMLQIGSTFSKYKRLVRDLSKELGKEINLLTEGEDTELDKTVIEKLGDPLVHLVRNSVDHGIELPDEREAKGKPRQGTVTLTAEHSGDSVLIRIKDDGKGLDKDVLLKKAVEKGIVAENAELTEKEIYELIFAQGFSTAQSVSNVSGRGVGMDVVKRNIDALRGTIDIDSTYGEGTVLTLKLPLTLAIIDGLLVDIDKQFFIVPLSMVNECIEFKESEHATESGRQIIKVRDELIPYVKLRDVFEMNDTAPERQQIVIMEIEGKRIGFVVDDVVGDHQTVIKSLGKTFKKIEYISGASVLGDGSVALIIDIVKILTGIE